MFVHTTENQKVGWPVRMTSANDQSSAPGGVSLTVRKDEPKRKNESSLNRPYLSYEPLFSEPYIHSNRSLLQTLSPINSAAI